eukprot:4303684-Prymnesium_polylepis.1
MFLSTGLVRLMRPPWSTSLGSPRKNLIGVASSTVVCTGTSSSSSASRADGSKLSSTDSPASKHARQPASLRTR